jgi:hypothetical protein
MIDKKPFNSALSCLSNVRLIAALHQKVNFGRDAHDLKCRAGGVLW